jgi:hypothetical protein
VSAPQATTGADGVAATAGPGSYTFSAPSPAPAPNTDKRSAAGSSASPTDTAKEVSTRQDSGSPSAFAPTDQAATRVSRAPTEPAPFAFLSSPWFWLLLGVVFAALSFFLGRRLRST